MKYRSLFIILLLSGSFQLLNSVAFGQKAPMKMPLEYVSAPKGNKCSECADMPKSNSQDWVVYADRAGVQTYAESGGGNIKDKLNFMQPFYVVEEKGDYLHIMDFDKGNAKDGIKGKLKKDVRDFGWCKKDDLVLWSTGIVNKQQVTIKLLSVIKDQDVLLNMRSFIKKGEFVRFYNSPECKPEQENEATMDMFQFLYLYKVSEANGSYLVGFQNTITGMNADKRILGWVPKKVMEQWGDRLCLQPNPEIEAATDRKDKRIKAALLVDKESAMQYYQDPTFIERSPNKVTNDSDPYEKGWDINQKRLPVFSKDPDTGIIETGYISQVVNEAGAVVMDLDKDAEAREAQGVMIEALRTINVVFVIDGGANMTDFNGYIIDAINKMVDDKTNNSDTKNKLRFGAVVYRSEEDKDCPDGDQSVSVQKIHGDPNETINFINAQKAVVGCGSGSGFRNVRRGLYAALQMLDGSKTVGQTSYIILIGAAGDKEVAPDDKYSDLNLAKMMAPVQPNMMVFQNIYAFKSEFAGFSGQAVNWLIKGSEEMVKRMKKADENGKLPDGSVIGEAKWGQQADNYYALAYDSKFTARKGEIAFPNVGANLSPEVFSKKFETLLTEIYNEIESQVSVLSFGVNTGAKQETKKGAIDPSVAILFTNNYPGIDLGAVSDAWDPGNYQFFFKCYTVEKPNVELKGDVFERVLFYTQNEYDNLIKQLGSLSDAGDGQDQRQKLKDSYIKILEGYYGESEVKEMAKQWTTGQVQALIQGVAPRTEVFKSNVKLNDITDVNKFSQNDLSKMVGTIDRKKKELMKLRTDEKYFFRVNENICYWIPESFLP